MGAMISILAGVLLIPSFVAGEEGGRPLPVDDGGWELSGDARVETYLGRPALRMRTARALRRGFSFEDGTIDLDLALTTHRTFSYVELRRTGPGELEEFYFRSHKSELPDAIQYTPVWRGVSNWQLFHGPGYTASAAFPREQWFPVRIVLKGTRAAVFVRDLEKPRLVVPRLRRDPVSGGIELGSFLPTGGAPDGVFTTSFSNVVARPGLVPFAFPPEAAREDAPAGVVREWRVSPPFEAAKGAVAALPVGTLSAPGWTAVPAESSGLVVVDRFVERPETAKRPAILARIIVDAESDGLRRFRLGYSDEVTVFLDGRPLFSGDAHYSFDAPRQEGLIGLSQATVYLPLRRGRNELVLAVTDVFGGWGWMGQFEDAAGLVVTAK